MPCSSGIVLFSSVILGCLCAIEGGQIQPKSLSFDDCDVQWNVCNMNERPEDFFSDVFVDNQKSLVVTVQRLFVVASDWATETNLTWHSLVIALNE